MIEIDRRHWHEMFDPLWRHMGGDKDNYTLMDDIETDVFLFRDYTEAQEEHGEEEEQLTRAPNFHYKPTDFRVVWYKKPFRASYANRYMTDEQVAAMVKHCIASIRREG